MTTPKSTFHTTPIYYVNDVPHPGHAYTTIAADTLARARRLRGPRRLLPDRHRRARPEHRAHRPREGHGHPGLLRQIAARFRQLWDRSTSRYDRFIRTTDEIHKRGVLAAVEQAARRRRPRTGSPPSTAATYSGWYCPRCEDFKDEDELQGARPPLPRSTSGPASGTEEENYFFRLSAYSSWLEEQIRVRRAPHRARGPPQRGPGRDPQGLKDFSVSRARVKWGIPVPEEPSHVFYVWMDALANYITALGFADDAPEYVKFWEEADERMHFVGKEIIRFHCLVLAGHAARGRRSRAHARVRARLAHARRAQAQQDDRATPSTPTRSSTQYGVGRLPLLLPARGLVRPGLGLHGRRVREALQQRPRQRPRQPRLARAHDGRALLRRQGAARGRRPLDASDQGLEARFQSAKMGYDATRRRPRSTPSSRATRRSTTRARSPSSGAGSASSTSAIVAEAPWEMAKDPARRAELARFLYRLLEAIRLIAVLLVAGDAARLARASS